MTVPLLDDIRVEDPSFAPDIAQLTTKALDGTGVFDQLMKVVKLHLQEEYDLGRLSGTDYSNVYLGALQAVMQQSVQFLNNQQVIRKTSAEIGLIRQKTVTELANTDDDIPQGLGFNGDTLVQGLVSLEKVKVEKQNALIDNQIANSAAESKLVGQKIVTELAQVCDNLAQASAQGFGLHDNPTLQGMLAVTKTKAQQEGVLMEQKVVTELAQTSDTKPDVLGSMPGTAITGAVKTAKDKIAAEMQLLGQKTITEFAQTGDQIPSDSPGLVSGVAVGGTVKKQQDLFVAQTNGFARDAEQKLAKMMIEAWSVDKTVGDATANESNQLLDNSLGAVIEKAKEGIAVVAHHS